MSLIDECARASSLSHEQLIPAYIITNVDRIEEVAACIEGKRMTLARITRVLEAGRDGQATLDGDPNQHVAPGEGSTDLLRIKLDCGGFSAVSRNSAEDLRDKADYLGIKWTKQFGIGGGETPLDAVGDELGAERREQDAIPMVARREVHIRPRCRTEQRQQVGRARP